MRARALTQPPVRWHLGVMSTPTSLVDPFGRAVSYLRISVTDRCDLRCVYCMSEDMTFLPKNELLSFEEIERIAGAFVGMGTRKIRLTGGEPLVRKGIMELIQTLGKMPLDELTLTTNGTQLERYAGELFDAGVRRINVSIDTLDAQEFALVTRGGKLDQVLRGLAAAKEAGLKVKINTVAISSLTRPAFEAMIAWCASEGFDQTFIEVMPMGDMGEEDRDKQFLPLTQLRDWMDEQFQVEDLAEKTGGPARYMRLAETGQKIGFISPLTRNFCEGCNRVRMTCTGMLYMCLGQDDHADLRAVVRDSNDPAVLEAAIREAITRKPWGHEFYIAPGSAPAVSRHMSVTGG